jgi:hypothetical protein
MNQVVETAEAFDRPVPMRLKLAALWTSTMFCYIYADYFALYIPGTVADMLHGRMAPFGAVNQAILLGTSTMMAIPSLMIALSLLLPFRLSRTLNIVTGVLYTVIIAITMWSWAFFILYGVIEMLLTGAIAWYAWRWGRGSAPEATDAGKPSESQRHLGKPIR